MHRRIALIIAVFSMLVAAAEAQVVPGRMIGVVRDESGAVLPGASVTLTSTALPGGPVTVVTNVQGEYRFTNLPPGTYALSISLSGFSGYEEADLRVAVNSTTERNVRLPLASVKETITVRGDAPLIDP